MKKYLLDTNIISYLDDPQSPFQKAIVNRLSCLGSDDAVYISILSLYEFQYSIFRSAPEMKPRITQTINMFVERLPIINLSAESAQIFGNVKSMYKENIGIGRKELDRHNIDFILAASAITKKAVMVSNDSIFEKIKGIYPDFQFENWTQL
ncbi:type II toxin-antitoxin system VapC family toxin [Candidatus Magnetominusculus dajiuhuensis]|uniref:type II toxin-antitoxin system VapC family toxin n=1 Tax=Candidatus Magnetominusculus dajiuhuensis TaxID=3137712 RepID=UPI003B4300B9